MHSDQYQQEYSELKNNILHKLHLLNKHDKIRANQWLQKLDIATNNDLWKKNKNFYMKTLLQMVIHQQLIKPFSQAPPEGPLPKLTVYDIDYPIRQFIQEEKKSSYKKRSGSAHSQSLSQRDSARTHERKKSITKNEGLMAHKRKIIFEDYVKCQEKGQQNENCSIFGNLNRTMKTEELFFASTEQQDKPFQQKTTRYREESKEPKTTREYCRKQKGLNILRRTLKLLGNHYNDLHGEERYKQVLEKIVKTGEILGEDLGQVTVADEESIKFEKYNERIKEKLHQTDLSTMSFLDYLRKVNSNK